MKPKVLKDSDLVLKPSQIPKSGRGVFTKVDIFPGDTVGFYTGDILSDFDVLGDDKKPGKHVSNLYLFYVCKNHWIRGNSKISSKVSKINHARKKFCNTQMLSSYKTKQVRLEATKFIPAGAELFWNYGKDYWKNMPYKPSDPVIKNGK